jgi:hypothetical protein
MKKQGKKKVYSRLEVFNGENSIWAKDRQEFRYSIHHGSVSAFYGHFPFLLIMRAWISYKYGNTWLGQVLVKKIKRIEDRRRLIDTP